MPSPLAHSSLILLARPLLGARRFDDLSRRQRWVLLGLIIFALCVPDVDFLFRIWSTKAVFDHGGMLHSFVMAAVFGVVFAVVGRWVARLPFTHVSLWCLGTGCFVSHLILDALTRGRGPMLFWPLSVERFPVAALFYGAEHSQPLAWRLHLITLATELLFASLVWMAGRWILAFKRSRQVAGGDQITTGECKT